MRAHAPAAIAPILIGTLLCILTGTLSAREARACSICGCDPSGGTLGLERPGAGDLRFSVEGRYLQKESGAGDANEGEKEARTLLRLQYSPVPRISFGLDLPFYAFKNHYGASGLLDENAHGLADTQVGARWEFLQLGGLVPRHTLAASASLKLPTGDNNRLEPVDDGTPDEHKQLGTGTWDTLLGLWYTYGDFPWVAYAGVQGRVNGTNARGFRYGNALFGTLGVRRTLFEGRNLYLSLEAQGRNAGYDHFGDGARDGDSGGFVGYATLGAGYQFGMNFLLRGTLQLPVVTSLNGTQGEHPVGFIGLAYDLSI